MACVDDLIKKYDVPVPRYTSYPTVPFWDVDHFTSDQWIQAVKRSFDESNDTKGISLYIHLPFCESLCTYCACNTRITKNHNVEDPYNQAVFAEWRMYQDVVKKTPVIRELHLGGGTPTFFSPEHLKELLVPILQDAFIHDDHEFSFEGHPNNTTAEHLQMLYSLGFSRVSYGVQDLDPKVQLAVHRIQPFENLERVTRQSRTIGYRSVSFDLIYGLPYQTTDTITHTVEKIISLRPDRIAFYSYAHVPWIKPGQRGYEDADLPTDVEKRSLYETGRRLFKDAGYLDIGMDHFALPSDTLAMARQEGRLHRNFMGYTTTQTDLLIGLGTSAISDAKYAYAQNLKSVETYQDALATGKLAIWKGHIQTEADLLLRKCILEIACKGELDGELMRQAVTHDILSTLSVMSSEGLVDLTVKGLRVTEIGRIFIRNICSVFDQRLQREAGSTTLFSKAI
ncbi:MAG: oxygen-independent coproporphyrinogen III oxidase [Cyclobacteriaceae bacterium]|nr:oxygen-independent coproporphyrinogen III oxidase [Cyclobacteriaceae bacterium]